MIAYAIKHKDGKFWQFLHNDKSEFVDDICNAFFHYSKQDAERSICFWELKDCEVVEVTIVEGDLEQELNKYKSLYIENEKVIDHQHNKLSEKDKEIEDYKKALRGEMFINFKLPMEHAQFKRQLAEKDKEIEELKTRISELQDKDWYEACIKQLEEQNDKLIKERDALQSKVSNEEINSTGIIPKPKFNIGSTVIAKTINCIVVIEDRYYDNNSNKWLYQFHAPSSVMDDDYYSTYSEDYLDEIEKGE